jgi:hypothetical protein
MTENQATRGAIWFYDLQLALLPDGGYHLYIAENTVDEHGPQLLCREILDEHVVSIDEVLTRLNAVLTASS